MSARVLVKGYMVFKTSQFVFIIRYNNDNRLKKICFRGKEKNLAGNFSAWASSLEMLQDADFMEQFTTDIRQRVESGAVQGRVCIHCSSVIGWSSTDEIEKYVDEEDLEEFSPNIHSTGLRVKKDLITLAAPRTHLVTVIYEIRYEPSQTTIVIHSLYPGRDIGELKGNVSIRESCVFFDWDHPGEV